MNKEVVIKAENLSVSFLIQRQGINNIKDFLLTIGLRSPFEKKTVLKNLNLTIYKGECLGILGRNGSGKSTFLRTIAGVMQPDEGTLQVNGKIAPLMALGVGLEPELSGYENIKLVGVLMGMTKSEMKSSIQKIVDFSELTEEDLQMQVKRYSSGMMARLAFSIAVATDPDILIIDEALAVGDLGFRRKCAERIDEIKKSGSTILYVSHHIAEIKNICTRAVYLKDGKVLKEGSVDEICELYQNELQKK
jgi:ABC-type polysaccharide/polyol phosphate transport system ATPase subunit